MIGRLAAWRPFASGWLRAIVFLLLIGVSALAAIYPPRHLAATSLTPTDPESLGLSGTLGQLGAINSVFGNQTAVEVAIRVARGVSVRNAAINDLRLTQRLHQYDRVRLHRWLEDRVNVRALRGGIITIEMTSRDPALARDVVGAYAKAVQQQLAQINRRQTAYKRDILLKLVSDSAERLATAQNAYDSFRLTARYADPRSSMQAIAQRIPQIEIAIRSRQVQLEAARKLFTDNHLSVKQIKAELAEMQAQLDQAKTTSPDNDESVGRLVGQSSQLFKLERELAVAKSLYDSYMRYLQGTAVEDMTSTANVRVLEAPYIDTTRQYYLPAVAAAIGFLLLWMAIEFYRLRPPAGARLDREEAHA